MSIRLTKPWRPLSAAEVAGLPGQLGVYELADSEGHVLFIGCAGGNSLFGLRGELESQIGRAASFRFEVTTAYRTRHRELLMAYHADHGCFPSGNPDDDTAGLGGLSLSHRLTEKE